MNRVYRAWKFSVIYRSCSDNTLGKVNCMLMKGMGCSDSDRLTTEHFTVFCCVQPGPQAALRAQILGCRTRSGSSLEQRSLKSSLTWKLHSCCLWGLVYVTVQQEVLRYIFVVVFWQQKLLINQFYCKKIM